MMQHDTFTAGAAAALSTRAPARNQSHRPAWATIVILAACVVAVVAGAVIGFSAKTASPAPASPATTSAPAVPKPTPMQALHERMADLGVPQDIDGLAAAKCNAWIAGAQVGIHSMHRPATVSRLDDTYQVLSPSFGDTTAYEIVDALFDYCESMLYPATTP